MALQASGSISFSQIANEFGLPPGQNLGAYRISQSVGSLNLSLDSGIPSSGSISFGNFYGKKLNIVVDLYSIADDVTRRNARNRYDNNNVEVIGPTGGTRSKPASSTGTKVYVNVNKRIGSSKDTRRDVALRTGNWDASTELIIVVGPTGGLYGAGGNGGNGAGDTGAQNGGDGSSALGIDYSSTVITQSGAVIRAGRGGGGGGASGTGAEYSNIQSGGGYTENSPRIGGGGGAGGSGLPAGNGGNGSNYISRLGNKQGGATNFAGNGGNADATNNGGGGSGGSATPQDFPERSTRRAFSGAGGNIEDPGASVNNQYRGAGLGGQRGFAIIVAPGASLSGTPNVNGDIDNPGTIN